MKINNLHVTECDVYFNKLLCLVGEIGENDIIQYVSSQKIVTKIWETVSLIIEEIANTISICYVKFKYLHVWSNHYKLDFIKDINEWIIDTSTYNNNFALFSFHFLGINWRRGDKASDS